MINLNFIVSYNRPRIETDLHSILINPPNYIIYFYITILYNYIIYYTLLHINIFTLFSNLVSRFSFNAVYIVIKNKSSLHSSLKLTQSNRIEIVRSLSRSRHSYFYAYASTITRDKHRIVR